MPSSSILRACMLTSAVVVGLAISGCAASDADEDEDTSLESAELRERDRNRRGHRGGRGGGRHRGGHHFGQRGPQHIEAPQGVFFADINANGTGCPEGTWDVAISEDGETFTLAFNAYEAKVTVGVQRDVKDCQLDIKLGSPEGLSYSIASFYYQGYVLLDKPGMLARQTASYSFGSERSRAADKNDVSGPIDESYLYTDEIGPSRRVWSPCRRDDTLHVQTRLVLKNDEGATGEGYLNNSTVDGELSFKWKLNWRRCGGGGGGFGGGGHRPNR
jgi:hypothetical protein